MRYRSEQVEVGIDSISLNPDAMIKTTLMVLEAERYLHRKPRDQDEPAVYRQVPAAVSAPEDLALCRTRAHASTASAPRVITNR